MGLLAQGGSGWGGASAGLVSAASSSWLHKRAAVNSVTREVFPEIPSPCMIINVPLVLAWPMGKALP